MSDLPSTWAQQQEHAHPVSGEHLEVLGKKAAADWGTGKCATLTEAVMGVVKEAQLSPEQIKRVVEFTNTSAFLTSFRKEGAAHRVIEFHGGPADTAAVLQDCNDGGGGSVFDRGTLDYSAPPSQHGHSKHASADDDAMLCEMFGVKEGSAEEPFANPYGPVIDLRDKLAGAANHLLSEISGLEVAYAELGDAVYHQVKQAALEGVPLGQVLQAWETIAPAEEYIKVAFTLMTPRFLREGVFASSDLMLSSFDKVASNGSLVNPEHPLMVTFGDFCGVLQKLAELRGLRDEALENHKGLTGILKNAGAVAKAVEHVTGAAAGAAEKAKPHLKAALGDTAGGLAAGAIHYAPHMGAAIAGNEAYQHVKNSPSLPARAARGAVDLVARQVPGSQAAAEHEWRIQNGQ